MGRHDTHDWYDDDAFAVPQAAVGPTVAGLPESWWNYDRWLVGIAYAGLWMLETWTADGSAPPLGQLIRSLGTLVLALACCYGLFALCAPHSRRLGRLVAIAAGVAMLLAHSASDGI